MDISRRTNRDGSDSDSDTILDIRAFSRISDTNSDTLHIGFGQEKSNSVGYQISGRIIRIGKPDTRFG